MIEETYCCDKMQDLSRYSLKDCGATYDEHYFIVCPYCGAKINDSR
jgi:DNA-directed RNA polymerase subunit RPC12/RpoP